MKTILITTDFSAASVNSGKYGVKLAQALNSKVELFTAYQTGSPPVFDIPVYTDTAAAREVADRQLLDLARQLNDSHLQDFSIDAYEGPIADSIIQKVKECSAELIITGMKRDHKELRKLFGSTITSLIRKSPVPLIVVPEGVTYQDIATIAVAFESDVDTESNPDILKMLQEIADHFHSKVYTVKVSKNKLEEAFALLHKPYRLTKMLRSSDPVFESISNKNVEDGILQFVLHYHVDLLVLLPHRHSIAENLVRSSFTRKMIFDANLPLLILPESK